MPSEKIFLDRVKENTLKLTKSHKLVIDYIFENKDKATYMTASKISEDVGVSETTVIRVASTLGYKNFSHMQSSIREEFILNKSSQRLQIASSKIDKNTAFSQSINTDIMNIQTTMEKINMKDLEEVIRLIGQASNIYTIGFRSSIADAHYLGFGLNKMLGNVTPITSTGMSLDHCLENADKNSLIISFAFSRYSKDTVESTRYLKNQNTSKVVSVTDSIKSPLVSLSDYFFLTSVDTMAPLYSHVPSFTIINAILATVGQYYRERVSEHLHKYEKKIEKRDVFYL